MAREPALVKVLPRAPGTKESRYGHLLSGEVDDVEPILSQSARKDGAPSRDGAGPADRSEMEAVRSEVAELRREVAELKESFAAWRKRFE